MLHVSHNQATSKKRKNGLDSNQGFLENQFLLVPKVLEFLKSQNLLKLLKITDNPKEL